MTEQEAELLGDYEDCVNCGMGFLTCVDQLDEKGERCCKRCNHPLPTE